MKAIINGNGKKMYATELIYKAAQAPQVETQATCGTCAVCGKEIEEGVSIKKVVSTSFMDWNVLADMTSPYVCAACAWCIKETKTRRSQYIALGKELIYFKRDDIEQWLFNPPEPPFVIFITASYKKHGSFKARVNGSQQLFYVQFEDRQILFSPNKYRELFDTMKLMYTTFNKIQEIGKGWYIQKRVKEYGLNLWREHESIVAAHRGSQAFDLLLYALNKPEDVKK